MMLEQLLIQPIRRIDLIQPWRAAGKKVGVVADSLLAGAMAIHFADSTLMFRSPLRFACCQTGTVIGVRSSGAPLTLGYRFDVVPSEDVDGLFAACEPRLSLTPDQWSGLSRFGKAEAVFLLADLSCLGKDYFLRLRLLDRGWCSIRYRPDLDGAIELSPENARAEVPRIVVTSPADEFGWLHPASAYPFVLDGLYWRTAHPRDWPWPLVKGLQSQPTGAFFKEVMTRALHARFAQHESLRTRLLNMMTTAEVNGLPWELLDGVRRSLANLGRGYL